MTKKYTVLVTFDASRCVEVEAENEEQAKELAMETVGSPCLCHQCSDEVEIGDPIGAVEAWESNGG